MRLLTIFLVSAGATAATCAILFRAGRVLGWVDLPDDPLKAHRRPAVPLGGVAIWIGVNLALWVSDNGNFSLLLGSLLLLVVGLLDDRKSLSPLIRVAAAIAAGLIIGIRPDRSVVAALLVAALALIAVNAVNLFDGLDGLAGFSGLICAAGTCLLALGRGQNSPVGLAIAAGLVGFLAWNWHPARLFLGDNGAYVLALFLIYSFDRASSTSGELLIAVALLGVFLIDMTSTFLRRLLNGQPLFSRDRLHLYDRLVDRGYTIPSVALVSGAVELVLVAAVLFADRYLPVGWAVTSLVALGTVVVGTLMRTLGAMTPGYWARQ